MLKRMEPMPSIAEMLLGSAESTSWNSLTAAWPMRMFSSEGAPGMYCVA